MPTRPTIKPVTKQLTSVGILRAIFNDPNNDLLYGKCKVDNTTDSIRAAGEFITAFVPRANQFINAIVNRIGLVRIQSLIWNNPWTWAKQGKLEMGETVEEIWMDLAKVYHYCPEKSETRFLKREKPSIFSAFHSVNYRTFYKVTIEMQTLKNAFLSLDGLADFTTRIIDNLSQSANFDEFMLMKYTIAVNLLAGAIPIETIPAIDKTNGDEVVTAVTTITNNLQFPLASAKYNRAGAKNASRIDDIYILESTDANALLKVNVLANAFNIDEVKFMGHVVMHDGLGNYDWVRMRDIFEDDDSFTIFSEDQIEMLNKVKVVVMDRKWLQIYDHYEYMGEPLRNGEGLYENYFYHVGKVLSSSPFHNCIAMTDVSPGVITITVSPGTATVTAGQSVVLTANVTSTGFNVLDVEWSLTGAAVTEGNASIENGVIRTTENAIGTLTATVTSVADPSKKATATITIV